jgi:hypothetical protein
MSRRHVSPLALLGITIALASCTPAANDATAGNATADAAAAGPSAAEQVASAAATLNPLSSAKDQVLASVDKFKSLRSYHATMRTSGGPGGAVANEIDFVAPDRFRMKMPMGTQVIIGDTMYMNASGRTMKLPMPKGTLTQWRDPANMAQSAATMTVEAQGSESVDGVSARKYLVHHTQPKPVDVTMWIGSNGYPLQIRVDGNLNGQTSTTTIRYSRINDPTIRIDPPQ